MVHICKISFSKIIKFGGDMFVFRTLILLGILYYVFYLIFGLFINNCVYVWALIPVSILLPLLIIYKDLFSAVSEGLNSLKD